MNEIVADVSVLRILMMGATWPYVDVVAGGIVSALPSEFL